MEWNGITLIERKSNQRQELSRRPTGNFGESELR